MLAHQSKHLVGMEEVAANGVAVKKTIIIITIMAIIKIIRDS